MAEAEKNLREEKELVMRLKREIIVLQHNNQMAVRNQKKGKYIWLVENQTGPYYHIFYRGAIYNY